MVASLHPACLHASRTFKVFTVNARHSAAPSGPTTCAHLCSLSLVLPRLTHQPRPSHSGPACSCCSHSDELGQHGVFPSHLNLPADAHHHQHDRQEPTLSDLLSDSSSLIGQLAPGLRLCLAAEVATGLLCDRWGLARWSGSACHVCD
jgi:hypothetical protein